MTIIRSVFILIGILLASGGSSFAAPSIGDSAPALKAPEIGGGNFDLSTERGKVVIVNFWATWCAPCRAEMPALDAFYAQFHAKGVDLIGISLDHSRDRDSVSEAAQAVHYPIAILADLETNGFGKPATLPITYIVDPAGKLRAILTPDTTTITEDSLEQIVTPFLSNNQTNP